MYRLFNTNRNCSSWSSRPWLRLCQLLAAWLIHGAAVAQVVSVPFNERGFLFSSAPTLTFLWPAQQARATLVFIPGGEGRLGLSPERKTLGGFYGATLKPLSDASLSSGAFHVVVFDSPVNLPVGADYPVSRQGSEHLARIESVVRYYKERYALPVLIMGHSNGAASLTEFYKMLQASQKADLVEGAIYSSGRDGSSFNDDTALPVLFLAHERDGCEKSKPSRSRAVYERLRSKDAQRVDYVLIHGGEAQAAHPCYSGYHMFYAAGEEAYRAIDQFVFQGASPGGAKP